MITAELLHQIMPRAGQRAAEYAPLLEAARKRWVGGDWHHVAMWLAQIAHESGDLRYTLELADGTAYEGRADLGNTQPGDGPRFRGRGLLQVTGRANYTRCAEALALPLLERPELLEWPEHAASSAGWVWLDHGLGARCEAPDPLAAVTRRLNGGTSEGPPTHLALRRQYYVRAIAALKGAVSPTTDTQAADGAIIGATPPPPSATQPAAPPAPVSTEYPSIGEEPTMPLPVPALIALGAELLKVIPWGKKNAERIEEVAPVLVNIAKTVAPAGSNEQAAVEAVMRDKETQAQFVAATAVRWSDVAPFLEHDARERAAARTFAQAVTAGDGWRAIGAGMLIGVLSLTIILGGGAMFWSLMGSPQLDPGQKGLILGALLSVFSSTAAFWFGSSASSRTKDQTISEQARR